MPDIARQILIVDDSEDIRSLIKLILMNQGYVCHTADGTESALAILKSEPVELALVDVIMPGMTGLSLFKQIRQSHPETAIVFVTNVDDMNLAFDTVKEGAYDYIIKSTIPYRLVETVEHALGWRAANLERNRRMDDLKALAEHQNAGIRLDSQESGVLNERVRVRTEDGTEEAP